MTDDVMAREWEHFQNHMAVSLSPGARESLRQAFYAGAHRMYYAIAEAGRLPHDEAAAQVGALQDEIDANAAVSMAPIETKH